MSMTSELWFRFGRRPTEQAVEMVEHALGRRFHRVEAAYPTWQATRSQHVLWFRESAPYADFGDGPDDIERFSDHWLKYFGREHEAPAREDFKRLKALNVPMVLSFDFEEVRGRFQPAPAWRIDEAQVLGFDYYPGREGVPPPTPLERALTVHPEGPSADALMNDVPVVFKFSELRDPRAWARKLYDAQEHAHHTVLDVRDTRAGKSVAMRAIELLHERNRRHPPSAPSTFVRIVGLKFDHTFYVGPP